MNKKGDLAYEEIIFIILNLTFFILLMVFIFRSTSGISSVEQISAKELALIIDQSYPGERIYIDFTEQVELARKNKIVDLVNFENNLVRVKLSESGEYTYSFFNDVNVESSFESKNSDQIFLVLNIFEK